MDPQAQALLQAIFRRESCSFLLYIGDAFPWTTSAGVPALARLARLIVAEKEAVTALGRYLVRRKVPVPFLGAYPTHYTSFNFLALAFLVPKLIADQQRLLAALERDLSSVTDAAARAELTKFADLKRQHLAELEQLLPAPQTVSA